MRWEALWGFVYHHPEITVIGAITIIQIAPIKLDPWGAVIRSIKRLLFGGIETKIDTINKKVDKLECQVEEDKALRARTHILRFADELYDGAHHTREYFDNILQDIDMYEEYSASHPSFKNNKTVASIKHINDVYQKLFEEHGFK